MPGLHLYLQLPQFFNPKLVLNQLRYSGMLETVRIRRAGYPVRRTYEDFLFRYKVIVKVIALREGCLCWLLAPIKEVVSVLCHTALHDVVS